MMRPSHPSHPLTHPRTRFVRVWDTLTAAAIAAAVAALVCLPSGCKADLHPAEQPSPIQVGMSADSVYAEIVRVIQQADACTVRAGDNPAVRIAACRQADRLLQDAGLWLATCRDRRDGTILPTDACLEEAERLFLLTRPNP